MNETEADRIAAMAHALRPDWPLASVRTLLGRPELLTKARRDVAVALAWVACESETKTPARVLEAGPWWAGSNATGSIVRYPPRRDQACPKHPGEWPTSCRGCAGDRLAADESDAGVTPEHRRAEPRVADVRAKLHAIKAVLCSHGVTRTNCLLDHDKPADQEPTP